MDVDETTFWPQLLPILRSICNATFVAIDLEMSGIPIKGRNSTDRSHVGGKPSMQELYEEIKEAASKYQVLQLGITCVEEDRERDIYVARPYNFNVSPLLTQSEKWDISRDFTFQSGAIHFLIKNSFNVGAVFTKGVPYLSREEESLARFKYGKRQEIMTNTPDILISPDDIETTAFYTKVRKTISDFTNQKKELDFVNIGYPNGLNGFQRRLVYQLVRNEFPACRTFARNAGEFMQVENLDPDREAMVSKQRLGIFESGLARQTGLRFVFEALAGGDLNGLDPKWFRIDEHSKPVFTDMEALKKTIESLQSDLKKKSHVIVGHNMFIDLIYIYQTFVGTLPDQMAEFRSCIHKLFPKVFDTKYLATEAGSSMRNKSSLKDLCEELKDQHNPFIALAERHVSYGPKGKEHEAGYDSWMTAQVFIKLSSKLAAEQELYGSMDGAMDSESGTSKTPVDSKDGALNQTNNDLAVSNIQAALRAGKQVQNDNMAEPKGTSQADNISNTSHEPRSKEVDYGLESSRSSTPDLDSGGVSLAAKGPAHERSLMDSDIDDNFKASFGDGELLKLASVEVEPNSDALALKSVPGGLSRYYYAAKLNGQTLPNSLEGEPKENPWMPSINSTFWNIYANRLRVYATETEICCLDA